MVYIKNRKFCSLDHSRSRRDTCPLVGKLIEPSSPSALSCALVAGGTASALAARVYVDGGTWDYGTNSTHVWSNYHHPSVRHATSAHGKFTAQSGCKGANQWANASAPQRPGVADQSYYRFC